MLRLDDVTSAWNDDCHIDKVLLDESSLVTPNLHAKYLDYLVQFKKQKVAFTKAKKGFPIVERRGNPQFEEIENRLTESELGIETTQEIIHSINQRQWIIKNTISWRMFVQGVDV